MIVTKPRWMEQEVSLFKKEILLWFTSEKTSFLKEVNLNSKIENLSPPPDLPEEFSMSSIFNVVGLYKYYPSYNNYDQHSRSNAPREATPDIEDIK